MNLPVLYQGSVKEVRGPLRLEGARGPVDCVVFDYTDAYSVFDWGRMPDLLPGKGAALAIIAADWFERLEKPETWKDFSRSADALALRRGNRFGAPFNELGEALQRDGLRTHYLGVFSGTGCAPVSAQTAPFSRIAVRGVSVVKPRMGQILGRGVADYNATRAAPIPRLIPLEVVFRFSCPGGSSLLERVGRDPSYLTELGYGDLRAEAGSKWEFPVLELFTKLESTDRPLTLAEALAISGLSAETVQEMLFRTAWVAGWLKSVCGRSGLELADGKLEWALNERCELLLVDAIGPDELRILKDGVQLSKEFLRAQYRAAPWYAAVLAAKREASLRGSAEWKKGVAEGPSPLAPEIRELGSQLYQSLANELTGRRWYPSAWDLGRVTAEIERATKATVGERA